jgi:hypothetical protein
MVPNSDTHPSCWVVKKEDSKQKPVPSKEIKISWNNGESQKSSYDKKSTSHPFYSVKRNIFEHDSHDVNAKFKNYEFFF